MFFIYVWVSKRKREMEEANCSARMMSAEIVEIVEETSMSSRDVSVAKDVYVAVGKDDLDVLKWALDHAVAVSPAARIFLVHVFPPITYIPTPVGRLSMSQLSKEQVRVYINEEHNRRSNLMQKYIRLCNEAKVTVDTMLLESDVTAKAILDLIPVLNITSLVIGTKRPPCSRRLGKKMATGEFVKKNAPDFCEVIVVHDGKKVVVDSRQVKDAVHSSLAAPSPARPEITGCHSKKKFFECVCFAGKFNN